MRVLVMLCLGLAMTHHVLGGQVVHEKATGSEPVTRAKPGAARGLPRIQFEEVLFAGAAENGVVSHEFGFRNAGAGVLTIDRVQSTCGCTIAEPEKTELAPGESSLVRVTFRVAPGRTSSNAYVQSNDLTTPWTRLTISMTKGFPDAISILPYSMRIPDITTRTTASVLLQLTVYSEKAIPSLSDIRLSARDPRIRTRVVKLPESALNRTDLPESKVLPSGWCVGSQSATSTVLLAAVEVIFEPATDGGRLLSGVEVTCEGRDDIPRSALLLMSSISK